MIGLTSLFLFPILYELMERKWNARLLKSLIAASQPIM
jgi:hypothetical protein